MGTHAAVVALAGAIEAALESLAAGNAVKATLLLYKVLPHFRDSRLASNQEVWQLYEPFLAVVTVCASRIPDESEGAMALLGETVRLRLSRVRP